jgi:glycosyltransferase involved in cell wall biosynthesis
MMPQKRLDILLRAFAKMTTRHRRLVIVGDGPQRRRLELLAKRLGVADRVSMPGFSENPLPMLRSADLLALSSDYEGLPAVVFEALACNVPVVTTDSFGAAKAVLDPLPRSAVVPLGDIDGLAQAMDESLARRDEAVDLQSGARPYSTQAAIGRHLEVLRPLLQGGPR